MKFFILAQIMDRVDKDRDSWIKVCPTGVNPDDCCLNMSLYLIYFNSVCCADVNIISELTL